MKREFVGILKCEREDGGMARYGRIGDDDGKDTGMFMQVHSWDDAKVHEEIAQFEGKKVKITIEVIE